MAVTLDTFYYDVELRDNASKSLNALETKMATFLQKKRYIQLDVSKNHLEKSINETLRNLGSNKTLHLKAKIDDANIKYNSIQKELNKHTFKIKVGEVDTASLQNLTNKIQQAIEKASKNVKVNASGGGSSNSDSSGMGWTKMASKLYAIRAMVNMLGDAFNATLGTTIEFEKSMSNLAAILQTNRDGILGLEEQALRLGRTTNYTASQVVQLQTELSKLGYNEQEVRKATSGVLEFAQACGTDLASAATTAGSAIRAFGADASETKEYVATMAIATTRSALQFSDFQTIIGTVFPVAHQFNLTIQDTTALMMKLKDAGMNTSTAATSLRNIFLNLSNKDSKLSKLIGMDVHDMDTFVEAMKKMRDASHTMGTDFLGMSGVAAGKRGVTAFNVIAEQAKSLYRVRDSITDVGDELDKMAGTQTRNAASAILRVKSAWEGWMLSMRESDGWMMALLDGIADEMNKIHDFFTSDTKTEDVISTEMSNAASKVQDYVFTLKDVGTTEEQREKAAKSLADQLIENGIVTEELVEKMKDQYNYYDWLIGKETELTATLRVQAAERVAIREQENAQEELLEDIKERAKQMTLMVATAYKNQNDKDMPIQQQRELEQYLIGSYHRMAIEYHRFAEEHKGDDAQIAQYAKDQQDKMLNDMLSYIEAKGGGTIKVRKELFKDNLLSQVTGVFGDYVQKMDIIKAYTDAYKNANEDAANSVDHMAERLAVLNKELEDNKNADGTSNLSEDRVNQINNEINSIKALLEENAIKMQLDVTTDTDKLAKSLTDTETEVENWRKRLSENGAIDTEVTVNYQKYKDAIEKLKKAQDEAKKTGKTVDIEVIAEVADALKNLQEVGRRLAQTDGQEALIHVKADVSAFDKALDFVRRSLHSIGVVADALGIDLGNNEGDSKTNRIVPKNDYTPTRIPKPSSNSGSRDKKNKKNGNNDADRAEEKFNRDIQSELNEYKKAREMYFKALDANLGQHGAIDKLKKGGFSFSSLLTDDVIDEKTLDEWYKKNIDRIIKKLEATKKMTPKRKELLNSLRMEQSEFQFNSDKTLWAAASKYITNALNEEMKVWNNYKNVLEKTGDAQLAVALSGGKLTEGFLSKRRSEQINERALKGFNASGGYKIEGISNLYSLDQLVGMDDKWLKDNHLLPYKPYIDEYKKAKEDEAKEDIKFLLDLLTSGIDKLASDFAQIEYAKQRTIEAINAQKNLSPEEKERLIAKANARADWQTFAASGDFKSLTEKPLAYSKSAFNTLAKTTKDKLVKALQAGVITSEEYADKVKKINEAQKKYNSKGGVLGLLTNSVTDMLEYKRDKAEEDLRVAKKNKDDVAAAKAQEELDKVNSTISGVTSAVDIANNINEIVQGIKKIADSIRNAQEALGKDTRGSDVYATIDALSASSSSLVEGVKSGTPMGIISGIVGAFTEPISIFAKNHDEKLQKQIEQLARANKALDLLNNEIRNNRERTLGHDTNGKYGNSYNTERSNIQQQLQNTIKQRQAEEKKKDSDADAILDYKAQEAELLNQYLNYSFDLAKELYSIDLKGWASQFGDALVEAWSNGTSAADAFANTAKNILTDMANNWISETLLQPKMKRLQEYLFGTAEGNYMNGAFSSDNTLDGNEMKNVIKYLHDINEGTEEGNKLLDDLDAAYYAEYGKHLKDENMQSLGNSISQLTESTGDLLSAYLNEIRQDVHGIYSRNNPILNSQLEQLQSIAAYTERNAIAAEEIQGILTDAVNGTKSINVA